MNTNANELLITDDEREYAKCIIDKNPGAKEHRVFSKIKVDGIACDMMSYFSKKHSGVHLTDPFIMLEEDEDDEQDYYYYNHCFEDDEGFDGETDISVEKIAWLLAKTRVILRTLVFDKMRGILIEKKELKTYQAQINVFKEFMEINVCCVCLEQTLEKTKCGHSLCMACWQKIEPQKYPMCPMCRECIRLNDKKSF